MYNLKVPEPRSFAPVPYWESFKRFVVAVHPEWEAFFTGEVAGHYPYAENESRFFFELPSEHPTMTAPLIVEIADREPPGPIDVYWGRYFEHVFNFRRPVEDQFAQVMRMVEEWTDDSWVFAFGFDGATEQQVGRGRFKYPLDPVMLDRIVQSGKRLVFWSWNGSHDGQWPPEGAPH